MHGLSPRSMPLPNRPLGGMRLVVVHLERLREHRCEHLNHSGFDAPRQIFLLLALESHSSNSMIWSGLSASTKVSTEIQPSNARCPQVRS